MTQAFLKASGVLKSDQADLDHTSTPEDDTSYASRATRWNLKTLLAEQETRVQDKTASSDLAYSSDFNDQLAHWLANEGRPVLQKIVRHELHMLLAQNAKTSR